MVYSTPWAIGSDRYSTIAEAESAMERWNLLLSSPDPESGRDLRDHISFFWIGRAPIGDDGTNLEVLDPETGEWRPY